MPYDPTIYQGAAVHYRPGRPPYSPQLEGALVAELGLDGTGRLLDVGCGPGILALRLASLFGAVVGLDPDADMLAQAAAAAAAAGVTNVEWVRALAEDLPAAAPGPHRVVTFGQSFHWTDEDRVADLVHDALEPGGALVLISHTVEGRPRPQSPGPPPIPHEEIKALIAEYLGSTRRAGQAFAPERTHRFEDVLGRSRFGSPRVVFVPGVPDLMRSSQSVVSGVLSLASSAPHLYGERLGAFTSDLAALLAAHSPSGWFWDWPGDTEVVIGRKSG